MDKESKPLTLQEAKDQVAKNHYYSSWDLFCRNGNHISTPDEWIDEVIELYARSKEKEGFKAGFKKGLLEGKSNVKSTF